MVRNRVFRGTLPVLQSTPGALTFPLAPFRSSIGRGSYRAYATIALGWASVLFLPPPRLPPGKAVSGDARDG